MGDVDHGVGHAEGRVDSGIELRGALRERAAGDETACAGRDVADEDACEDGAADPGVRSISKRVGVAVERFEVRQRAQEGDRRNDRMDIRIVALLPLRPYHRIVLFDRVDPQRTARNSTHGTQTLNATQSSAGASRRKRLVR